MVINHYHRNRYKNREWIDRGGYGWWLVRNLETQKLDVIFRSITDVKWWHGKRWCLSEDAVAEDKDVFFTKRDAEDRAYILELKMASSENVQNNRPFIQPNIDLLV